MFICNDLALIQAAMAEQDWRNHVFASRRPETADKVAKKAAPKSHRDKACGASGER